MNRTCQLAEALKSDEPLIQQSADEDDPTTLPSFSHSHRALVSSSNNTKQQLNKTGIINLKDNLLINTQETPKQFNIPPIVVKRKEKPHPSQLFGDKEKSKTTNIADILQEVKRSKQNQQDMDSILPISHHGSGNLLTKIDHNQTGVYDITKFKKGSFHSQSMHKKFLILIQALFKNQSTLTT